MVFPYIPLLQQKKTNTFIEDNFKNECEDVTVFTIQAIQVKDDHLSNYSFLTIY